MVGVASDARAYFNTMFEISGVQKEWIAIQGRRAPL